MTAEFRTFIRGIWQREGAVPLEIQAVQPQPVSVFNNEQSELMLDLYDELGAPLNLHEDEWTHTIYVKKQLNNAPSVIVSTGLVAASPPNRVVFTITADDVGVLPFGRYVYNVISARGDEPARVTVPPSLFHISPTVR